MTELELFAAELATTAVSDGAHLLPGWDVKRVRAALAQPASVPADGIDYEKLVADAWSLHKYRCGTPTCIAFKNGAEWQAKQAPQPAQADQTTGALLMGLAVIRELTGTQQQDLEATIDAVRAALAAPQPEAQQERDREKFMAGYAAAQADAMRCDLPPVGWVCTRKARHDGPCAAVQDVGAAELVERGMARLREAAPSAQAEQGGK